MKYRPMNEEEKRWNTIGLIVNGIIALGMIAAVISGL